MKETLPMNILKLMPALTAALCMCSSATAQTVLTMSSWLPASHPMTRGMLEVWAADVEKATHGRIKLRMLPKHPSAPPGTFDAVKDGLVDVSYVTASFTPARHLLTRLPELPGGGGTAEVNSVAYWRMHEKYLSAANEYKGVKLLSVFTHGPGQMLNTKRPITSLDDLTGLKFRTAGGISEEMARAMGASSFVKSASETYELLSTGVADGTFAPLESVTSFKLERVVRYATIFPGGFYCASMGLFMNEDRWNKLPKEDQDAILSVSGEKIARTAGVAWDAADRLGVDALKQSGAMITEASPAFRQTIADRAKAVEDEWVRAAGAKGVNADAILREFRQETKHLAGAM